MEVFARYARCSLRDAASKKILVEVALLKAIEARNAVSIDTVLQAACRSFARRRARSVSRLRRLPAPSPPARADQPAPLRREAAEYPRGSSPLLRRCRNC